jgi:hypothetical protein
LIQEIGRFIHRAHIADNWFVNIGDCPARIALERDVVFRYGRGIGDPQLQALAAQEATVAGLIASTDGIDLGRALHTIADLKSILAQADRQPPYVRDAWLGSDDLQMMMARDREGSTEGFFLAAWGGHNAQSHNHNDVGNFLLFADGQPVFIDLGAPTYTAQTFSGRRYEIPAMQSAWHNLPTINDAFQSAGLQFAAQDVVYRANDDFAELVMDIARAWPAEAGVTSWRRTVRLDRGREVLLREDFRLEKSTGGTHLHLLTPSEPRLAAEDRLDLPLPKTASDNQRTVSVWFDPQRLQVKWEPCVIDDGRLAGVWGRQLHRIMVGSRTPSLQDTWELRVRLQP